LLIHSLFIYAWISIILFSNATSCLYAREYLSFIAAWLAICWYFPISSFHDRSAPLAAKSRRKSRVASNVATCFQEITECFRNWCPHAKLHWLAPVPTLLCNRLTARLEEAHLVPKQCTACAFYELVATSHQWQWCLRICPHHKENSCFISANVMAESVGKSTTHFLAGESCIVAWSSAILGWNLDEINTWNYQNSLRKTCP